MIFNSIEFLLCFLPFFFILYGLVPARFKNIVLLLGSLIFYTYGEKRYVFLLVFSIIVNYLIGLYLGKNKTNCKKAKLVFGAAITGNVAVLALFKVCGDTLGFPLGLSFYTFQIVSYITDVYKGKIESEHSFINLATYVSMFPKLISGPIANYDEVSAELSERTLTAKGFQDGLKLFVVGLSAKVLLADRVGILWHEVQVTGFESISVQLAWTAAFAYSMKIYFDFYGYSLMAVGLGRMLGFHLPENFKTPYMAGSVRDFYRRWHMTLGRWFCQYVYIPLGGSKKGEIRTVFNLFVVWMLTAVWHGSTVNFLLWGGLLWLCIVLERQAGRLVKHRKCKLLPHLYLWFVIPVSWMCFAITDTTQLGIYLGRMFGILQGVNVRSGDWIYALERYGVLLLLSVAACTPGARKLYEKIKDTISGNLILACLFWICVHRLIAEGNNTFMYFSF